MGQSSAHRCDDIHNGYNTLVTRYAIFLFFQIRSIRLKVRMSDGTRRYYSDQIRHSGCGFGQVSYQVEQKRKDLSLSVILLTFDIKVFAALHIQEQYCRILTISHI
ncbi:hypothetical protein H0G86_007094 [Trichoderma simmonsii]|uniref:Uncharacterized protein n=1 Tax=Trichoderma simmonsii TaxID=1491479 RepID=A0A8G0LHE1_9HYPO|nr:hypothetical protein H0G86_007094 [Trichoderma simmonsii]